MKDIPSNVVHFIIQESKQIVMSSGYGCRCDMHVQFLCIVLYLELIQSLHDGYIKWLHIPE